MGDVTQCILGTDGQTIQSIVNGPSHHFRRNAQVLLEQIARDQERPIGDLDLTEERHISGEASHLLGNLELLASEILTFSGSPEKKETRPTENLNTW
ncbi:MAG: hypothetical protein AAB733_00995 [Patescibacteria group bacterium]